MSSPGVLIDFLVRFGQPSDLAALAGLREALWPESSAEEHSRELASILAGDAPGALPLVILVAEASDGSLAFSNLAFVPVPKDAIRRVQSGTSKAGTSPGNIVSVGLAKSSWLPRKNGRGAKAARRWLRTP